MPEDRSIGVSYRIRQSGDNAAMQLRLMKQCFTDSFMRFKRRALTAFAATLAGILCELGSIFIAVHFARLVENGAPLNIWGHAFIPRESVTLLVFVGLALGLALLAGAALIYSGKSMGCRLSRKYEEFCIRRVYNLVQNRELTGQNHVFRTQNELLKQVSLYSRQCGRYFLAMLELPTPLLYFLISLIAMLIIDLLGFGLIVSLLSISLILLYNINQKAAECFKEYEDKSPKASSEKRRLLKRIMYMSTSSDHVAKWLDWMLLSGAKSKSLDAYEGYLVSTQTSVFLHGIIFAVMISFMLIFLGFRIIIQGHNWGLLLVFLIALRFFLSSLRQLITISNTLSRFSPQLIKYFEFIAQSPASGAAARGPVPDDSKGQEGVFEPGEISGPETERMSRLAIVSSLPFSVYSVHLFIQSMRSRLNLNINEKDWFFLGSDYDCPQNTSLEECFGRKIDPGRIESYFKEINMLHRWKDVFPSGLAQVVQNRDWAKAGAALRMSLGLLAAEASGAKWIVLEASAVNCINRKLQFRVLDSLNLEKIVIVYPPESEDISAANPDYVFAVNDMGIVAGGSLEWFEQNREAVLARLLETGSRPNQSAGFENETEADELEYL